MKVNFNPDRDIPDLSGKVIYVTGGNTGLGKETILQLCKHNPAQIFLGTRSQSRADAAIREIQVAVPDAAPISFIELDLGSFESIKRSVQRIQAASARLDILVNNAGIMGCPADTTEEGYEVQFGTNHMGHALLTRLLLPTLLDTAKAQGDVRIISLASNAESWSPSQLWDFSQLKTDMSSTPTFTRYGISKLANVHHSRALSRRYPDIRCISVHPGAVQTDLGRGLFSSFPVLAPFIRMAAQMITKSPAIGAKNQLWACVSNDAKSGEFYYPVGLAGKGSPQSQNRKFEDDLWDWTEKELASHI